MNNKTKKIISLILTSALCSLSLAGCGSHSNNPSGQTYAEKIYYENETHIILSDKDITANGKKIGDSGTVFASNDVIYYEDKDFYESGNPYGEGTDKDKHSAEDAAAVTVVNITEAGTYRLSGRLSNGQIRVDLGEDASEDKNAVVTLVLDGIDINCDVAPAIVFMNVYECDGSWDAETATKDVDTSAAGANVIISDNSTNNVEGAYVAKIFKDKEGEKKLWKQDGAFYSYMSMNIDGEAANSGVLNITADNEGLGAELHLTINGGNLNIISQDDGINTNEDNVSVAAINGGNVHILAGLGENGGDGIDSNGWVVVNGGTVVSAAHWDSDSGIDNENGAYIDGGTLISFGGIVDWPKQESKNTTFNLQFKDYISNGTPFIITDENDKVVFCYNPCEDTVINTQLRNCRGVIISSPQFNLGEIYHLYLGGTVNGKHTMGIYDAASVKDFNNAVQQMHYSDEIFERGGFIPNPAKEYTADANFAFNRTVSCFAEITG